MKKLIALCVVGLALTASLGQAQTTPPPLPAGLGMTLQPLAPTTLQQWYSLWQQNIIGDYQWETADVVTSNFGNGFLVTDPATGDNTGAGENLDWQLAPVLTGLYWGYMATSDTQYVDMFVSLTDQLISVNSVAENTSGMFVEPDGYPGWPALGASGDSGDTYVSDSMLADGAVGIPIALMGQQMISDPQLSNTYAAKGTTYLNLTKTLYQKWVVSRGGWRNTTIGPGAISVVLPYGINPANPSQWIDFTTRNDPGNGFSHPCNKANELGMWLLAMYDATGDSQYLTLAQSWFTQMKYRMTLNGNGSYAIWNYWQPAGLWDYNGGDPANGAKLWIGAHPNGGYYEIDTEAIVAAYEHGVVFTSADIAALVKTAKTSWKPSAVAWGSSYVQYYFDPSTLQPGMSVSYAPATAAVQSYIGCTKILCGCVPNFFTAKASSAWSDVQFWTGDSTEGTGATAPVNGTIVSSSWNGSTGSVVIKPDGGGPNVTVNTDKWTEVFLLRLWTALLPYDTEIQSQFESGEDTNPNTANDWGAAFDSEYLTLHAEQDGTYVGPTGAVQVTLAPAAAIAAGAQWNVDGGPWQSSGATVSGLSLDGHEVYYNTITGWTSPSDAWATVTTNTTTTLTGTYTQQFGSLTVTLAPAAVIAAGAQWNVDGGTWMNSGDTVSGMAAGVSHTVNYSAVANWNSPASASPTINNNQTTSITGTYTQGNGTGSVQVTILPAAAVTAGAQWNVDGSAWQNSGAIVSGLAVGAGHTINYNTILNWTSPAPASPTITNNTTTNVTGTYIQQTGSLMVTLAPAAVVTAGAQWNVDGGAWMNSGVTVNGLAAGVSHTVNFSAVVNWNSPAPALPVIAYNTTTSITGTYGQQTGSVQVTLAPAAAVTAGAQWNVDGGAWQNSGAIVGGLFVGVSHTINYNTIANWNSPASASPAIAYNTTTSVTGTYVAQTGSVQVTLAPAGAIAAGAQWNVDGGVWQGSGATVGGLFVGIGHTINYKTVVGWNSPASAPATVTYNNTTTATGTYVQQTGSLTVTLAPSAAVTAGAQWNVDGGAWMNSGATVSGLAVGVSHTVNYSVVANWNSPAAASPTISYNQTTSITGTYTQGTGSVQVTLAPAAAVTAGAQWNVDGGAWMNSGATVAALTAGVTHTINYKTIPNWNSPAPASPTITNNTTTTVTGTYVQQTGSVQVTLAPAAAITAGAQWNVDGGAWQSSGAIVGGLAVGVSHTVNYNTITGWNSPPSTSPPIIYNNTTSVTGTYVQQFGSLTVTLLPTVAARAGARWRVDGGAWQSSGALIGGLAVGVSHTISYNTITGWNSPASAPVTIAYNKTTSATGTYVQQTGSVQVTLGPAAAITAGAQWNVDGGAWQNSGATVSGLAVGGGHMISYKAIAGWNAPPGALVTITYNNTATATGTYVQQTASLTVRLAPAAAITAGAQWCVDGGAWQKSGAVVSGLAVSGSHTITYKPLTGWNAPASAPVTLTYNKTTIVTATYIQQAGSVQVMLAPAAVVTAGAQWNVDGGAWQNSGATVGGLSVGAGHTINYKTIGGWTSPPSAPVTITYNNTTTVTGTYVQQFGSVKVTLLPAAAVTAGAQWRVDGGAWQNSGATVTGLAAGAGHTVSYRQTPAWAPPVSQPIEIFSNSTVTLTGTYIADLTPPTVSNEYPAAGDTFVAPTASIKLRINDSGSGVNLSTVQITASRDGGTTTETICDGSNLVPAAPTVPFAGSYLGGYDATANGNTIFKGRTYIGRSGSSYVFSFQPDTDAAFGYDETVTVSVSASDWAGNVMPASSAGVPPSLYSFTIAPRSFGANVRADGGIAGNGFPATAADAAGDIWVAWERNPAGTATQGTIWLAERKDPAGATKFGAEIPVTSFANNGDCHKPAIAISASGTIYAAYEVHSSPTQALTVMSATTALPAAWTSAGPVTGASFTLQTAPAITFVNATNTLCVAAVGADAGGVKQIGVATLAAGGTSWTVTPVTTGGSDKSSPAIAQDASGVVYVVWTNTADNNLYGADSSSAWAAIHQVTSTGDAGSPGVATESSGNVLHFVWAAAAANPDIQYADTALAGGGWPATPLTAGTSLLNGSGIMNAANPRVAVTGTTGPSAMAQVFVVWQGRLSAVPADTDIWFTEKMWNGQFYPTPVLVSVVPAGPGLVADAAHNPALGVKPDGTPFAAWTDLREAGASQIYFAEAMATSSAAPHAPITMSPAGAAGDPPLRFMFEGNPHFTEVDISIPADAFDTSVNLMVGELTNPVVECTDGSGIFATAGSGVYLDIIGGSGCSGTDYDDDVLGDWITVTIHLTPGAAPPSPLGVFRLVPPSLSSLGAYSWTADWIRNVGYDPNANVLTFQTKHLSAFGVGAGSSSDGGGGGGGCAMSTGGEADVFVLLLPMAALGFWCVTRCAGKRRRA